MPQRAEQKNDCVVQMKRLDGNGSIFANYCYNLVRVLCDILFPIITFAYTSRVLGTEGIGRIQFASSLIMYYSSIAALGTAQYGTREAAKLRDDRTALSKFTQEILCINLATTVFACFCLFLSILFSQTLQQYAVLIWIYSIGILLSGLGLEWLYQALEEYRFIAWRAIVFQIISLFLVFLFVRKKEDVVSYALISLFASFGTMVFNFVRARRFVTFRHFAGLEFRKHLAPMLWLFAMGVSLDLYTVLDTTMLGFIRGDREVGLYSAAVKSTRIINAMITALGAVLIPRLSYYVGTGEEGKLKELVKKGYNYVFLLSVPSAIGLFAIAEEIIGFLSGAEFLPAMVTLRIIAPVVVLIPFSVMTNQQTLVPLGREKLILLSTATGAVTNILCNSLLIPRYGENGAAVATIIAEGAVAIVCLLNARRFFDMREVFGRYYEYWIAALPILAISAVIKHLVMNHVIRIALIMFLSASAYAGILLLVGNVYLKEVIDRIRSRIPHSGG